MKFEAISTKGFVKDLKTLVKKYPQLKNKVLAILKTLTLDPKQGEPIGNDCYKIRVPIPKKNKGKSSGARMIHIVLYHDKKVYSLTIYDKSEKETLSKSELSELISFIKSKN